jgi:membrane-associated phospholipid phosphatase
MRKHIFREFSLVIEKYYIEIFTLEVLIAILVRPSIYFLVILGLSSGAAILFAEGLKVIIREGRPVGAPERRTRGGMFRLRFRSFPSAHSAIAMVFVGAFLNSFFFIPFLAFAVLVMYSRVYIKSHYIHDVIAGGLIGFLISYLLSGLIFNL